MALRPIHLAAVVGVNLTFGGAYVAGKLGVDHFPPLFFSAVRFLLVFLALSYFFRVAPIKAMVQQKHPAQKSFWAFCLAMGIGVYCPMYLSLALADGVSAILVGTQFSVPIAALLGVWWLKHALSRVVWFGILMAFSGVMTVGYDEAILGHGLSFLLIILSATFYAVGNVSSKSLSGVVNVLNLQAWMCLLSILPMLALSFIFEEGQWESLRTADWGAWLALLYSSLMVSLIGHNGMFALLRLYPVGLIMPYYVLTPIFGIGLGFIFFEETVSLKFYIGTAVALLGVFIVNKKLK